MMIFLQQFPTVESVTRFSFSIREVQVQEVHIKSHFSGSQAKEISAIYAKSLLYEHNTKKKHQQDEKLNHHHHHLHETSAKVRQSERESEY
jgi:hypothetical protein